jgi:hypothetical protein
MPIFTRDDRAVLFVHVPKTGGTTIEKMMVGAGWEVGFRATPRTHPTQSRLHRVSPQHYHADLLAQTLKLDRFDATFLVTRDPLARFRSEYAMRNKRHPEAGTAAHVEEWTRSIIRRVRVNPSVLDNHVRPQHEFLVPGARLFRLEDGMATIVRSLNEDWGLGLSEDVPRHLLSGSNGLIASRDVAVTAFVEGWVRDFYAQDYELLGYA